jgi:hypothetical protein
MLLIAPGRGAASIFHTNKLTPTAQSVDATVVNEPDSPIGSTERTTQ